jgi:hypothetical protein
MLRIPVLQRLPHKASAAAKNGETGQSARLTEMSQKSYADFASSVRGLLVKLNYEVNNR